MRLLRLAVLRQVERHEARAHAQQHKALRVPGLRAALQPQIGGAQARADSARRPHPAASAGKFGHPLFRGNIDDSSPAPLGVRRALRANPPLSGESRKEQSVSLTHPTPAREIKPGFLVVDHGGKTLRTGEPRQQKFGCLRAGSGREGVE